MSLQEKQKLIDQALDNSFAVSLGQGKFGQCLVRLPRLLNFVILEVVVQKCNGEWRIALQSFGFSGCAENFLG